MLAQELGEYKKAGLDVEIVDFKGGSQSLTAVIGGSADLVSGYFDHCVNLAAKNQALVGSFIQSEWILVVIGQFLSGRFSMLRPFQLG
jgi:NitT/TauT family transport system substrate-binding protein